MQLYEKEIEAVQTSLSSFSIVLGNQDDTKYMHEMAKLSGSVRDMIHKYFLANEIKEPSDSRRVIELQKNMHHELFQILESIRENEKFDLDAFEGSLNDFVGTLNQKNDTQRTETKSISSGNSENEGEDESSGNETGEDELNTPERVQEQIKKDLTLPADPVKAKRKKRESLRLSVSSADYAAEFSKFLESSWNETNLSEKNKK